MPSEAGYFELFYASAIQHPILLWLAAVVATGLCLRRRGLNPSLRRYCAALGVLSLLDAWLTSDPVFGVGALRLQGWVASALPLFFVLAGDFRFLLLVTSADESGSIRPHARGLAIAAGLTAIVPIFSQLVMAAMPDSLSGSRVLFLVYEVAFVALTLGLRARHPNLQGATWLRRVSGFVVLYYGLWVGADVLILAGWDLGYALRVIPNLLYYGGLIAMIGLSAPARSGTG